MRHLIAAAAVLAVLVVAGPAGAAVAPGRVAFAVGPPESTVDRLSAAVALSDGGAVLVGFEAGKGAVVAQVRSDGSLDASFGSAGVAHVELPIPPGPPGLGRFFYPVQLLRQADGRLVVVGTGSAKSAHELSQLVLVRLTPQGALDPTFGEGGVAQPGLQASWGGIYQPASLQPDGAIVVTGHTGSFSPSTDPAARPTGNLQWVVARLGEAGALDPSFGRGVIVEIPGAVGDDAGGYGTAVLDDGRIVAFGRRPGAALLTRLLPSGAPDPQFHGGVPASPALASTPEMLVHPDGTVDVLVSVRRLVRYRSDGEPDPGFGAGGALDLPASGAEPRLLPAGERGVLVYAGLGEPRPAAQGDLLLRRVAADGRFEETTNGTRGLTLRLGFGGGWPSVFTHQKPPPLPVFEQSSFAAAQLVRRPDGSVLVTGSVRIDFTGQFAVAGLTPSFGLDPAFGGAATPARLSLTMPKRQRAKVYARLKFIALRVSNSSTPALALIRARAGRRVIAQGVEALYAPGISNVRLRLTVFGEKLLRRGRRTRVAITARSRDLLAQESSARARGTLLR